MLRKKFAMHKMVKLNHKLKLNRKRVSNKWVKNSFAEYDSFNERWLTELKDSIYIIAENLARRQPSPTEQDVKNRALALANDADMVEPTESNLIDLDETPSINLKKSGFISALEIIKEFCQTS